MEQPDSKSGTARTAALARIALGAALITVCAWITVPFAVPFTMQLFAVYFTAILLGGKSGTIAVAVYLLLGAIGIPVFSGGKGGFSALIGPTGGYLFGMLLIGGAYWLSTRLFGRKLPVEILSLVLGTLLCYLLGTALFAAQSAQHGFFAALSLCVLPFLLPDACKLAMALVLGRRLRKALLHT